MTNTTDSLRSEPAPVKTWQTGRIAAAVATVLWLLLTLLGISLIEGVRSQHVPGFPNDGQRQLAIVIPLIGSAGSAAILAFWRKLPSWAKRLGVGISFLAVLLVFGTFGAGV